MFSMLGLLLGMSCLNATSERFDRICRRHCQKLQHLITNADVRAYLLRHKRIAALVLCVCVLMLLWLGSSLWSYFVVSGGGRNSTGVD